MGFLAARARLARGLVTALAVIALAVTALVVSALALPAAGRADAQPGPAPTVSPFTYTPAVIQAGVPVTFTTTASATDGGSVAQISWDLGSGDLGQATGASVTTTFATAGTYLVRVQATDEQGDVSQVQSQDVTVLPAEGPILEPAVIVKPKLSVAWVARAGTRVRLRLTCAFAACHVDVRLVTYEQTRGGKLVALSARTGRRTQVGATLLHIYPDQSRTYSVGLGARGRRLLRRFGALPLAVSLSGVKRVHRLTLR